MFIVLLPLREAVVVALRHLVQPGPIRVVSIIGLLSPLRECTLSAHAHWYHGPRLPVLINGHCRVDRPDHTSKSHAAEGVAGVLRGDTPGLSLLGLGELQLEVVTVGAIGVEEHLFLVSGRLVGAHGVLGDPLQV